MDKALNFIKENLNDKTEYDLCRNTNNKINNKNTIDDKINNIRINDNISNLNYKKEFDEDTNAEKFITNINEINYHNKNNYIENKKTNIITNLINNNMLDNIEKSNKKREEYSNIKYNYKVEDNNYKYNEIKLKIILLILRITSKIIMKKTK